MMGMSTYQGASQCAATSSSQLTRINRQVPDDEATAKKHEAEDKRAAKKGEEPKKVRGVGEGSVAAKL